MASDGYVIWNQSSKGPQGFKIIHQGQCDDGVSMASAALEDFLGADGLTRILAMLSYGQLRNAGAPNPPSDMNEFVDFVRRVQTPYYEEARVHFADPEVRSSRSDWNEVKPYRVADLRHLAETGQ
jgi:hypothetical protein